MDITCLLILSDVVNVIKRILHSSLLFPQPPAPSDDAS